MADAKLSDLTALAGANVATNDLLYIVDVSATTSGSKKITTAEFFDTPFVRTVCINIGDSATNSVDPAVNVRRTIDGVTNDNAHCFSDSSVISRSGGTVAYNSYDARIEVSGAANFDHFAAFQSASTYGTAGTIGKHYGLLDTLTVSAGTITDRYGMYVFDPTGAGAVTNNYGVYVAEMTKGGTANFAIYTAGTTESRFTGNVGVGTTAGAGYKVLVGGAMSQASGKGVIASYTNSGAFYTGLGVTGGSTGSGGISAIIGLSSTANHGSSGTLTTIYDVYAAPTLAGGVTTTRYGCYIADPAGAGTLTNNYGVYVADQNKGGTLNYAVYTAGDTPSRFEGPVHAKNVAEPTALADGAVLYAADQAAGNSCIHAKSEGGGVVKLFQGAAVADATGAGDVVAQLNALLARMRAAGLIAT